MVLLYSYVVVCRFVMQLLASLVEANAVVLDADEAFAVERTYGFLECLFALSEAGYDVVRRCFVGEGQESVGGVL